MDIRFSNPMGTDVIAVGAPRELILDRPSSNIASWPRDRDGGPQKPLFTDLMDIDVRSILTYRIITKNNGATKYMYA